MQIKLLLISWLLIGRVSGETIQYFDGEKSLKYIKEQCDLGPRFPGSPGHKLAIEYYKNHFKPLADQLIIFNETILHPYRNDSLYLSNILARFNVDVQNRILLLAHWDTREVADMDPIVENQKTPILGANDGASGVSILMVLGQLFKQNPLINLGIDILLVDGEDMGKSGDSDNWGLGTKEFAKNIPSPRPRFAICVDMVGDKELSLPIEQYSYIQAPELVLDVWNFAESLGYTQFKKEIGRAILDDHRVLYLHSGIPSINIIDFDYPNKSENYWHTLEDTPDKCSAESLGVVGTVILNYVYKLDGMF